MITGKWLVFVCIVFMVILMNLICCYGAIEHGDSIYEWMNWTLFRWILFASVSACCVMALIGYFV